MSASLSDPSPAPKRIEFEDPHAGIGNLQEAEVTRVRMLRGGWRWALVVATALGLLFWIAEGFGGIFTGEGTDPSTGPILILLAACYWPRSTAIPSRPPSSFSERTPP